ncbi:hypothetical protein L209DRAFT_26401 [Thermothelomyces heterothallicus CBS 203.75]
MPHFDAFCLLLPRTRPATLSSKYITSSAPETPYVHGRQVPRAGAQTREPDLGRGCHRATWRARCLPSPLHLRALPQAAPGQLGSQDLATQVELMGQPPHDRSCHPGRNLGRPACQASGSEYRCRRIRHGKHGPGAKPRCQYGVRLGQGGSLRSWRTACYSVVLGLVGGMTLTRAWSTLVRGRVILRVADKGARAVR